MKVIKLNEDYEIKRSPHSNYYQLYIDDKLYGNFDTYREAEDEFFNLNLYRVYYQYINNKDNKIISHKDIYAETSNNAKEILMNNVKNKYKIYIFDVEEL